MLFITIAPAEINQYTYGLDHSFDTDVGDIPAAFQTARSKVDTAQIDNGGPRLEFLSDTNSSSKLVTQNGK